jgi:ATP-dependent DNA helicase PIF1
VHQPELSPEQVAVVAAIEGTREHVFVTGRAGTGKSTLLEYLSWNSSKQLAICAPTGVAALNVGGQTIHSLFRLPVGVIANHQIDQGPELKKLLNTIDTLVVDEVSMVNADLLDAMDRSLRQARQRPHEAFGGVQLVLFGDPYQLAPVPGDSDERAYFADRYTSMWFFDARVWDETELRIYELGTIHRQHELEFKELLTAVRHGSVTAEMVQRLNDVGSRSAPADGAITLATTNGAVARINTTALAELPGRALSAVAEVTGDFGGRAFPADERLELKVGAQVMFLRNDTGRDGRWVNGTIGEVVEIGDTVTVDIAGDHHEVLPSTWERYKYSYSAATKTLSKDVVAEFTQFPLRLAWAITIHKSQGKSYDRAIVNFGPRSFAPGQTYVALSRITALDGLYFTRPLRPSDVIVDDNVRRFMSRATAIPGIAAG